MPKPSSATIFRGWLVSSRMVCRPRSDRICAPMPCSCCNWRCSHRRAVGDCAVRPSASVGCGIPARFRAGRPAPPRLLRRSSQRVAHQPAAIAAGWSRTRRHTCSASACAPAPSLARHLAAHQRQVVFRVQDRWCRRWYGMSPKSVSRQPSARDAETFVSSGGSGSARPLRSSSGRGGRRIPEAAAPAPWCRPHS